MEGDPFEGPVRLDLEVHVGPVNDRHIGDLDNFVSGVCDCLQTAKNNPRLAPDWDAPGLQHIHPGRPVALVDDIQVVEIRARKVVRPDPRAPWYRVKLQSMPGE